MAHRNPADGQPNILELIDGAPFPLTKVEIVEYAQDQDASQEALDIIQAMPDLIYKSVHEFSKHISEIEELPHRGDMWGSAPAEELFEEPGENLPDGTNHIVG